MSDPVQLQTLAYRRAGNGVAFITIDVKDRPVNVLTPELHREIGEAASMLAADDQAIGAVVHSGKASFLAGGDLNRIVRYYEMQRTPEQAYAESRTYTESLRQLETCGKPVAVAINGTALGGGLELALACHYRVVADDPDIQLGLPEVTLGLLPGGGGTQRLPRLIGLKQAAALILSGKRITPDEALQLGVVHRVAPAAELLEVAQQWVLQGNEPTQAWDRKGFRVPGGAGLNDMNIGRLFQQLTARVSADYRHNYPAPIAALRCLFNGTTVLSMDAALKIETREFSALTRDPVARNMIRTLFINRGKTSRAEILSDEGAKQLQQHCEAAYVRQGQALAAEGVKPALIENAAFAAGLPQGAFGHGERRSRRPCCQPETDGRGGGEATAAVFTGSGRSRVLGKGVDRTGQCGSGVNPGLGLSQLHRRRDVLYRYHGIECIYLIMRSVECADPCRAESYGLVARQSTSGGPHLSSSRLNPLPDGHLSKLESRHEDHTGPYSLSALCAAVLTLSCSRTDEGEPSAQTPDENAPAAVAENAPQTQAHPGEAPYLAHCASCHDKVMYKAPSRLFIGMTGAQNILDAMNGGIMSEQAAGISAEDRRAIAEYLSAVRIWMIWLESSSRPAVMPNTASILPLPRLRRAGGSTRKTPASSRNKPGG